MWGLHSWGPGAPSGGWAPRKEEMCVTPFMWMPGEGARKCLAHTPFQVRAECPLEFA